ncbi:flagellar motor switch protein FliN [Ramlibacter sp. H39-3-26]|uniref:flagellar motor switch protein FliN n=1 Tax=Curvibacter soli TaxID=3031331 RepID=UPI0023D9F5B4|nr:flagellar motor switch protein FliN [Ramlibacter sp. H39-3-26]MDF1484223.1 flagellar motor switch protein FliN [Ramlibacter sp. H39-3-26]
METNHADKHDIAALLGDMAAGAAEPAASVPAPRAARDLPQMMRKIPVTLTLEVGAARISLHDLVNIQQDSVIELDTLAGEPLTIKVNGTPIGRAEVVVAGENYGLKVVELTDIDFGGLS